MHEVREAAGLKPWTATAQPANTTSFQNGIHTRRMHGLSQLIFLLEQTGTSSELNLNNMLGE